MCLENAKTACSSFKKRQASQTQTIEIDNDWRSSRIGTMLEPSGRRSGNAPSGELVGAGLPGSRFSYALSLGPMVDSCPSSGEPHSWQILADGGFWLSQILQNHHSRVAMAGLAHRHPRRAVRSAARLLPDAFLMLRVRKRVLLESFPARLDEPLNVALPDLETV